MIKLTIMTRDNGLWESKEPVKRLPGEGQTSWKKWHVRWFLRGSVVEEENAGHKRKRRVTVASSLRFLVSAPPVGLYPSVHEQSKDTDADAL